MISNPEFKWRTSVLLAAICLLSSLSENRLAAAPDSRKEMSRYLHDVWTTEQGLPQNSITSIVQTRDGYLWLGTFGGLVRFDGVKFTIFTAGNTSGLESERILALYEDRQGALWIGTEHGGLTRYAEGTFTTYRMKDGLPSDKVLCLGGGDGETLWIGTEAGLVRLQSGRFQTYTTSDGLPRREVLALYQDRRGTLWIGTRGGLSQWTAEGVRTYTTENGLPDNMVNVIREGQDQSLWIGTGKGVARLTDQTFTNVNVPGRPLGGSRSLHEDRDHTLWVGSHDGLVIVRKNGQASRQLNAQVWAVFEDREKNLWVGTNGAGLHRWRKKQLMTYTTAMGLAGDNVIPITEDAEGSIWIGAQCDGLSRFKDGRFITYSDKLGLHNRCVRSLLTDRDGSLWIGTVGEAAHFKDGIFTRYGAEQGLANAFLWSLYRDRQGRLWIGTGGSGLYRFDDGRFTAFRVADGLVNNDVRFITEDREGNLWIGTVGGLSRFKDGVFTNYTTRQGLSHNFVRAVHEDADGVLWIGTYGGGLNRFTGGRFTPITTRDGLFDDTVSRILEDDRGNFWMSSNRGIFRVSRKELNEFAEGQRGAIISVSYGVSEGMESSECNGGGQPAGWRSRDGKLWFPTIKGVVVVDPSVVTEAPPLVAIERLLIDHATMNLWREVTAPPGSGNLEIHYTGLSFTVSEKVRFRYQLEGHDREWIDAGTRRVAYYTNLPPGWYRFRVLAMNSDGVWSASSAAIEFTLRPHFYQTRWFYILVGLAVAAIGWSGYKLRVKQLERRTRLLEATVAERTAEVVAQKDQLTQMNEQLELANENMLSVLDQLHTGAAMIDADGRITFLSQAAERMVGRRQEELLGQPWRCLFPLQEENAVLLERLYTHPPAEPTKVPVQLQTTTGRRYWIEIEVLADPRDPRQRIFFLYDVSEVYDLRRLLDEKAKFHDLIGDSPAMLLVYQQIQDLAQVDTTVLITGETGTGKELAARAIHYASARRGRPFVAVNCAGLTESLLTSQLFGHKRGAFTGAIADQMGVFEAANGGTLFLDEIGDIPISVQTNLLRALQEKEITRLGESHPRKVDVRVIAATNRDLDRAVTEGQFRQDLFYRIRVARVHLPPLRERRQDIPLLVAWFLGQLRESKNPSVHDVSQEAMQQLMSYAWPGNVRELKSAIEWAVVRCKGPIIQPSDLPPEVSQSAGAQPLPPLGGLSQDEKMRILDALRRADGNRRRAARLLGVSRTTLYRRMKELGIE